MVIAISALMLLMPAQATHAQGSSGKKIAATNKDTIPLLRNVAVLSMRTLQQVRSK